MRDRSSNAWVLKIPAADIGVMVVAFSVDYPASPSLPRHAGRRPVASGLVGAETIQR